MDFHVQAIQNASSTIAKIAQIQAPRAKKSTKRRLLNLKDDGILRVKDANRSIAERRAKEDEKEDRRVAKDFKKRFGFEPSRPSTDKSPIVSSTPILGDNGDIIAYQDSFSI
ncbi:hypothetical protein N7478_008090 [Penicillium angulare]|nr:uncharacterized protein N7478_008090 [Penicillium angulare]KAJ5272965.1 hypothetical protein N7478_008090 [Penicillium angulare]